MRNELESWVLGHKVSVQNLSGDYDLSIGESLSQVPGPPPHYHENLHESFYIVAGEMDFIINGEQRNVKAGESIDIPPKTLHTFVNSKSENCKWVNIHSPKCFGEFFRKYGISASEENAMEKSVAPEIIQEVLNTAGDYDMIIQME